MFAEESSEASSLRWFGFKNTTTYKVYDTLVLKPTFTDRLVGKKDVTIHRYMGGSALVMNQAGGETPKSLRTSLGETVRKYTPQKVAEVVELGLDIVDIWEKVNS